MGGRRLCSSNRPTVFGLAGWDVEACLGGGAAGSGQHIIIPAPIPPLPAPIDPAAATTLLCCGAVFLRVYCPLPPSLAYNHTRIISRLVCCCLFKSRRSNTHTTLLRKTVGAPRPLLEQLRKRSVRPFALPQCSLSPPIRTPLIKIPPSQRFFHLPRHRLHHHLTVTLTLLPAPAVSRAFLFSPRTRHISRTPLS